MNKIVIIQQINPQYRVDFFNGLNKSLGFEMYASSQGLEKSIFTVTEKVKYKLNIVKNIKLMNKAIFQFLPFWKLLNTNIVIFEFNLRIISNIFLLLIRIAANKKNILWTHGITDNMSNFSKILRLFFINIANGVIVYESKGKSDLMALGVKEEKIFIAKNSIDTKKIQKYLDYKQKKFRITFIGRINKEKNVFLLCNSFLSIINKIDPEIILTIIGNGDEFTKLKKLFDKNNRIVFTDHLSDEKQISFYLNQTLFTVSPDYLGLSIIHSFSYSVPILVNKFPKIKHSPEIELFCDNKNGWYFDGTQNDLEEQIIRILNNTEKIVKFGFNGLGKVKKEYGIDGMVKSFLKTLKYCDQSKNYS